MRSELGRALKLWSKASLKKREDLEVTEEDKLFIKSIGQCQQGQ